jgi:fructosamine-3-kinase
MAGDARSQVESALGMRVREIRGLSGGCVGDVSCASLENGERVVVKVDAGRTPRLDAEGFMLEYLAAHSALPVPKVKHCTARLLIMEFVEGDSRFCSRAEDHAADLLAELHGVRAERFGLEQDTLIGGLHQPNAWTESWLEFFRAQRLLHMTREAQRERQIGSGMVGRMERFCEKLEGLLLAPEHPSLLHGDVWTTNVLAQDGRITGFVDPAVYYGHPEIELAFITLFGTFGDRFFRRYSEHRGIEADFFEVRRDIYNLYPLLVHVRLFGAGYLRGIEGVLQRHGC